MRKFLAILLIATIACTAVEETNEFDFSDLDDLILEKGFLRKVGHVVKRIGSSIGSFMKGVGKVARGAIDFLKKNNLWDGIVSAVTDFGRKKGNELCSKLKHGSSLCSKGVDFIADKIVNK